MGMTSMIPGLVTIVCLYCSAVSTVCIGMTNNKGAFSMKGLELCCCCLLILLVAGGGAYVTATAP